MQITSFNFHNFIIPITFAFSLFTSYQDEKAKYLRYVSSRKGSKILHSLNDCKKHSEFQTCVMALIPLKRISYVQYGKGSVMPEEKVSLIQYLLFITTADIEIMCLFYGLIKGATV